MLVSMLPNGLTLPQQGPDLGHTTAACPCPWTDKPPRAMPLLGTETRYMAATAPRGGSAAPRGGGAAPRGSAALFGPRGPGEGEESMVVGDVGVTASCVREDHDAADASCVGVVAASCMGEDHEPEGKCGSTGSRYCPRLSWSIAYLMRGGGEDVRWIHHTHGWSGGFITHVGGQADSSHTWVVGWIHHTRGWSGGFITHVGGQVHSSHTWVVGGFIAHVGGQVESSHTWVVRWNHHTRGWSGGFIP